MATKVRPQKPSLHVKREVKAHKKFEKTGPFDWNKSSVEIQAAKQQAKLERRKAADEAQAARMADPFWLASVPKRLEGHVTWDATCGLSGARSEAGPMASRYEEVAVLYCRKWLLPLSEHEKHRRLCFRGLCYSEKLIDEMRYELDALGGEGLERRLFGEFLYAALAASLGWVLGKEVFPELLPEGHTQRGNVMLVVEQETR